MATRAVGALGVLVAVASACGDRSGSKCTPGTEGCGCADGACADGLVCSSSLCIRGATASNGDGGSKVLGTAGAANGGDDSDGGADNGAGDSGGDETSGEDEGFVPKCPHAKGSTSAFLIQGGMMSVSDVTLSFDAGGALELFDEMSCAPNADTSYASSSASCIDHYVCGECPINVFSDRGGSFFLENPFGGCPSYAGLYAIRPVEPD